MRKKGSLARQLLGWQLAIVFALLALVALISTMQSAASFRQTEGRKVLSVAEDVAAQPGVRLRLEDPLRHQTLAPFATAARNLSGADYVIITGPNRMILASPDPSEVGDRLGLGDSTVLTGRSWVGDASWSDHETVVAHVPVIADDGDVIGVIAAGKLLPNAVERIANSPAAVLGPLGIATVLGVAGSLLLAQRVKRQTLNMEPAEITRLAEHRAALLHGIKEGVLGLDDQERITFANDQARLLLELPEDVEGKSLDELDLDDRLIDVLGGRALGADQIVFSGGSVLVLNRMPISFPGKHAGAVVTLRDRTELVALQSELDSNRSTTDALRAQAHEFSNRLHTISGLLELGEHTEAQNYVHRVSTTRHEWHTEVGGKVHDPSVAALLIAKSSFAAEHGVGLTLSQHSYLSNVDDQLSIDLNTVLGNLIDNALDALATTTEPGSIEVHIRLEDDVVDVEVSDSGPGIAPEIAEEIFRNGFTTKAAEQSGQRGIGLALTKQICVRRGGSVWVRNAGGAVFSARLPVGHNEEHKEVPGDLGTRGR
ncbi:sensor histidine kinase regulating citrate/malate metabolism [Tamaricihabitans halophyticus]|uniref:histidine kinase n=1 Tax=Tamaricihabitans halophyticus TaxID=1262583 RepID=A0A4V2SUJ1_9PSEU|nr:sensor histidine kinase [Tamaricihabitans halophyticus]TCP54326.1 sensor histidine kinase regulating citrate/malate metabolism [Tamaricihabitans halophyticus]